MFQWECKTDMDNAYRFGTVEVSCEGYDYPEDPYIYRGSCGVCRFINITFVNTCYPSQIIIIMYRTSKNISTYIVDK